MSPAAPGSPPAVEPAPRVAASLGLAGQATEAESQALLEAAAAAPAPQRRWAQ